MDSLDDPMNSLGLVTAALLYKLFQYETIIQRFAAPEQRFDFY
jgi:uncharacterized protein Usg